MLKTLKLKYENGYVLVLNRKGEVVEEFLAEKYDTVEVYGNLIYVKEKGDKDRYFVDINTGGIIDSFFNFLCIKARNIVVLDYNYSDYRVYDVCDCHRRQELENGRVNSKIKRIVFD